MLKENQLIQVSFCPSVIEWYRSLGYDKKLNEKFFVKPDELTPRSNKKVIAVCDRCGKEYNKKYRDYLDNLDKNGEFVCVHCLNKDESFIQEKQEKIQQTNLVRYGVKNIGESKAVREKIKKTCLEKYGTEYTTQSEQMKEKSKSTCLSKYGVEKPLQNETIFAKSVATLMSNYGVDSPQRSDIIRKKTEETCVQLYGEKTPLLNQDVQEKCRNTCLENWGVEYSLQNEEVREKGKQTMLQLYGVENARQSKEVQAKIRRTLFKLGKTRTSKQQEKLYNILSNYYGHCELNFPFAQYSLDCVIEINGIRVDVEYDGWYWHNLNNQPEKDKIRDNELLKNGYKILRIKAGRNMPDTEILLKTLENLINSKSSYIEIVLPEWVENVVDDLKEREKDC